MARRFGRFDYYRTLQVDPSADPEIVRAAYRTLLRVLGRHPDRGGSTDDARNIIEAYSTLSEPQQRRAYDQWLDAHSVVPETPETPETPRPAPVVTLSAALAQRIQSALPDHREAPDAPFARHFDLVLEGCGLTAPRVYVRAYPALARSRWPLLFTLSRGVALARSGLLPSTDLVIFAGDADDLPGLLEETRRNSAPFGWHRHLVAIATLDPPGLHVNVAGPTPRIVRRLRRAFAFAP